MRHFAPENILQNIYYAHIESHINYGSIIWGNKTNKSIRKITKNQEKAICLMKFVKKKNR